MKRGILACLAGGFWLALKHPFLIVIKWLINIGFALLLAIPLHAALSAEFDQHPDSGQLAGQVGIPALFGFMENQGEYLAGVMAYWLPLLAVFILANLFVTGGILEVYRGGRSLSGGAFLRACGHHFPTLALVSLQSGLLLAVLVLAPYSFIADSYGRWLFDVMPNERMVILGYWIPLLIVALLLFPFVARVHGFARILACDAGDGAQGRFARGLASFWRALGFVFRRHWSSYALWALFVLVHLGVLFAYRQAAPWVASDQNMLAAAGLAQLALLARIWVGLATLGGELRFLDGRLTEAAPEPVQAPPPAEPEPEPQEQPAPAGEAEMPVPAPEPEPEPEPVEIAEPAPEPEPVAKKPEPSPEDTIEKELRRIKQEALGDDKPQPAAAAPEPSQPDMAAPETPWTPEETGAETGAQPEPPEPATAAEPETPSAPEDAGAGAPAQPEPPEPETTAEPETPSAPEDAGDKTRPRADAAAESPSAGPWDETVALDLGDRDQPEGRKPEEEPPKRE